MVRFWSASHGASGPGDSRLCRFGGTKRCCASGQGDTDFIWEDVKPQIAKTAPLPQAGIIATRLLHLRSKCASQSLKLVDTHEPIIKASLQHHARLRDPLMSQPASASHTTSSNTQTPPSQTRHGMNLSTRVKIISLQHHPCACSRIIFVYTASSAQPEKNHQLPELNAFGHATYAS